jgi:GNAT superfamily N-acetyltransferase
MVGTAQPWPARQGSLHGALACRPVLEPASPSPWIAGLGEGHYVDPMGAPAYSIRPLDESTWPAFAALVERNNGIFGGCWCMGFHPEGVGKDTTAELNRDRKLARVRAGTAHAALVFDGGDCVGWCQFGAPDEVPRIKSRAAYEKSRTRLPDWRIACTFVGKGHRRQGVAAAALAGALDLIAGLGGGTVEGYPEDAGSVPAGFLFNGALSTYEQLGFARDRPIGKHRWVVAKVVEPGMATPARPSG